MEHNNNNSNSNSIHSNHRITPKCLPVSCSVNEIHQIIHNIAKCNLLSRMLLIKLKLSTLSKLIIYSAITLCSNNTVKVLIMRTINLLALGLVRQLRSQGVVAIPSQDNAVLPKQVTPSNNNNNNINKYLTRIICCSICNTMLRNLSHYLHCRHSSNRLCSLC